MSRLRIPGIWYFIKAVCDVICMLPGIQDVKKCLPDWPVGLLVGWSLALIGWLVWFEWLLWLIGWLIVLIDWLSNWLIDWLIDDWLIVIDDWLVDFRLVAWLIGWSIDWLHNGLVAWLIIIDEFVDSMFSDLDPFPKQTRQRPRAPFNCVECRVVRVPCTPCHPRIFCADIIQQYVFSTYRLSKWYRFDGSCTYQYCVKLLYIDYIERVGFAFTDIISNYCMSTTEIVYCDIVYFFVYRCRVELLYID